MEKEREMEMERESEGFGWCLIGLFRCPGARPTVCFMDGKREVLFDQDHLEVYGLAREFARAVEGLLLRLPRGQSDVADQLRRATTSIVLNTAEGAGEFKAKEKARFYRMARRSGTESAAVMDTMVDRGLLAEADILVARRILHRVIGALTKLVRSCDPERLRRSV